ncbi:PLP-dependent aminotransferase family protein [Acidovorax sp. D4N7]|uniref:PLP-dependent aminotransferase family protein n=2 Tax=Comamonas endophytica TaxID=2949090 RepID=A0ABY6GEC6_9BURK|nr:MULTISPECIES: PLP-dependent aminotransferase family protein [unclassified Acidovorax]MCD2511792.1 PLP-dependent aminotransferase family protein [Acidovorax sp. D4N7]UYG53349.1 PLP-dependent aminotransferase family protein [Acidovorax sp. 5MLIR]
MEDAFAQGWRPLRGTQLSLVEQLTAHVTGLIRNQGLRPGMRLPSVRAMADAAGVSRCTVVQAYGQLEAQGLVRSRAGAGFFVCAPPMAPSGSIPTAPSTPVAPAAFDALFLMGSMFSAPGRGAHNAAAGVLPPAWLDIELVGAAIRSVGRTASSTLLSYGTLHGYRPLRQQIATMLQSQDVPVHPDTQLMTVSGATQGLDLVVRSLLRPGDTVFVEDPGWYVVCGLLRAQGLQVVGVPRRADGPDVEALARLAERHRPRVFIVNSAVHNPTGSSLSAGIAHEVLRVAERLDFLLIEDDTFADFHPGVPVRLAALDRLRRVLLIGGYAKTLGGGLRVGYVAGAAPLMRQLVESKLLACPTSPELGEQVVHRILAEGQYRRHVGRLRERVDATRNRCLDQLEQLGCRIEHRPPAGMFVWADCGRDSEQLAREAIALGLLLAPGMLFSPQSAPSRMLRVAVPMVDDTLSWDLFTQVLGRQPR